MQYIFLIIWLILVGFIAVKPKQVWEITQGWKAHREPPKIYFFLMRLFAVVFFIFGFIALILGFK